MIYTHETLYKLDSKGKVRIWRMESEGDKYRTVAGLEDGKRVTSEWTTATGKNAGKVNETSGEEQAIAEIEAQYKKKLSVDYHKNPDDIQVAKIFKPMLAVDYEKRKDKMRWTPTTMMQPKLDGIRCIANKDGLFSRTGKPIVAVPHIAAELKLFFSAYPEITLDGELYNHDLKNDFNKIVSLVRKTKPTAEDIAETAQMVEYHIYDIAAGGTSNLEFFERNKELNLLFVLRDYPRKMLKLVETDFARDQVMCDNIHAEYLGEGYEGSIIRLPAPYQLGKRSNDLLKRKDFDDAEFKVIGYEEGNGNFAGLPKVILIELENGDQAKATMTGTKESLQELKENFDDYIDKRATVQYFGITPDGQLRFPVVKALHKDSRW